MTAPPESTKSMLLSRERILSIYLPSLVFSLGSSIVVPVLPVFARSFDITFGVASMAFVIYQVGSLCSALPAGFLLDKIGRKPILIAGPILISVAAFLTATSQSFEQLLLYRFIGGLAEPLWMQARLAMIADTVVDGERGRQVTWMVGLQSGGSLFGPSIGGILGELFGVRVPFIFYGGLVLLTLIPSLTMVTETRDVGLNLEKEELTGKTIRPSLMKELLKAHVVGFMVLSFLANMSRTAFQGGGIDLYAVYTYGVGPGLLGAIATVSTAVSLPIPFFTGYIMDRWGRKSVITPAYALIALGLSLVTLATLGPAPLAVYIAAVVFARVSTHTASGTMQTLATDLSPAGNRGGFLAVWRAVSHGANVTGPALIALIAERSGFTAAFGTIALFGLGAAGLARFVIQETVRVPQAVAVAATMPAAETSVEK